jgi:type IV pilus assembly protein PilM
MKPLSSLKDFLNRPISLRPSKGVSDRHVGARRRVSRRRKAARPRFNLQMGASLRPRIRHLRRRLNGISLTLPGRRSPGAGAIRRGTRPTGSFKLNIRGLKRGAGARASDGSSKKLDAGSMLRRSHRLDAGAMLRRSRSLTIARRAGGDVVGLDIQPGFIAAVEADVNGSIRAARVATATLEGDVMPEGEVADEEALSAALREVFADNTMGRRVRIGVANQRTVLRILEVPPLKDAKELAAAVRFQAQDQVPMPLSNAVLDFHALGVIDTPGGPRQRVVLVAAQRDMIERLVGAVRNAGLRPVGVDLSAFALIRALFKPDAEHAGRVLYLNVDGLTNLAIAEGTSCRFNRVVGVGLEGIADEMARRTGVSRAEARRLLAAVDLTAPLDLAPPLDLATPIELSVPVQAESPFATPEQPERALPAEPDFNRPPAGIEEPTTGEPIYNDAREVREVAMSFAKRADPAPEPQAPRTLSQREVRAALEDGIRELVGEVRNTLDFHASQDGGGDVSHVVLSGQALDVPGFAEKLQAGLAMDVHSEAVGLTGVAGETASAGRLAVAAGLATVEAPR